MKSKDIATLYYKKGQTMYRLKQKSHDYTMNLINGFWQQLRKDYKRATKNHTSVPTHVKLPACLLTEDAWKKITEELGTKGHRIASFMKDTMHGLTIYLDASNIPIFNLIPKEINSAFLEKNKNQTP